MTRERIERVFRLFDCCWIWQIVAVCVSCIKFKCGCVGRLAGCILVGFGVFKCSFNCSYFLVLGE